VTSSRRHAGWSVQSYSHIDLSDDTPGIRGLFQCQHPLARYGAFRAEPHATFTRRADLDGQPAALFGLSSKLSG
jgi:hypothetical protein